MKKIIINIFYLGLLVLPLTAQAEIAPAEDAVEADNLLINIDGALNGYVIAQQCPTCPKLRLKINKNTLAIKRGKVVHLNQANSLNGKFATVIFIPKTKLVTKITW